MKNFVKIPTIDMSFTNEKAIAINPSKITTYETFTEADRDFLEVSFGVTPEEMTNRVLFSLVDGQRFVTAAIGLEKFEQLIQA